MMNKTFFKLRFRKKGSRLTSIPVSIPKTAYAFFYYVHSNTWPCSGDNKEDMISALMEVSFDRGKTWPFKRGFTSGNGVPADKYLISSNHRGMKDILPEQGNPNRKVKVTIDVLKDMEFSDMLEIT